MSTPDAPAQSPKRGAARQLGAMWLYTLLRFGLFLLLWGLLYLVGVETLLAGVIAAVLSIPLSFVLLARPREAFARTIQEGAEARLRHRAERSAELDPDDEKDAT